MKDKAQIAINRGVKAKALLENDLLNDWWDAAEANIVAHMKTADLKDEKRLLELKALLDAQGAMRRDFKSYVLAGERAQSKVANENKIKQLKRKIAA